MSLRITICHSMNRNHLTKITKILKINLMINKNRIRNFLFRTVKSTSHDIIRTHLLNMRLCKQTILKSGSLAHRLSSIWPIRGTHFPLYILYHLKMTLAKDYYFRIDAGGLSKEKKSQLVIEAAQYFYQSVN